MVEIVRKRFVNFTASDHINGMFVFKKSNIKNTNIPRLPILYGTHNKNSFFIENDGKKIEIFSNELNMHFVEGDIIFVNGKHNRIEGVLSALSNENTLLLTEQCENRCIFCSQPPNNLPDTHLYNKAAMAILNYKTDKVVGLTGGEPTINKNAFLGLLSILRQFDSKVPLHILTNGRNLGDPTFFQKLLNETKNREIIWGIPIYGHKNSLHNMIVGAEGAFSQTLNGLLNVSSTSHSIELRIVVVKQNYKYLSQILNFIGNSFPLINIISIMNLEPIGWAKKNYNEIHVSVSKQNKYLTETLSEYNKTRFNIRLFNYPLCLLSAHLRVYAVKSISDWKNYYPNECNECIKRSECCGYFSSAVNSYLERPKAFK